MGKFGFAALCTLLLLAPYVRALECRIVDSATGAGIAGATVSSGSSVVISTPDGRFQIEAVGLIMARAPGYRAAQSPASGLQATGCVLRLTRFTPHAVYLSVYGIGSSSLRNAALQLAQEGEINALVIDLKGDSGIVPFASTNPLVQADGARSITTIPNLHTLVETLHQHNIYAIARIVVFKDSPLAQYRPAFAIRRTDGRPFTDQEGLMWTDPFLREVWDYNIAIAVEAAQAGFDEIQFDYVRFPDFAGRLRLSRPADSAQVRVEAIKGFLTEARRRLQPYNVYLAVDIFGYVCWNQGDTGIGQELQSLIGIVDYLSPMLYPSCFQYGIPGYQFSVAYPYEIVHSSLLSAQQRLQVSPTRFRPWLQAFRDYAFDRRVFSREEVAAQIRAATDFGSDGWMLWNPHNNYADISDVQ
jgi:hypothetical protein